MTIDSGFVLKAADDPNSVELDEGGSLTIALSGDDGDQLRGYGDKLLDGGQMTVPLEQAALG